MRLRRQSNGEVITIETDAPLGKGGEARVYGVQGSTNLAAKVYESDKDLTERIAKLTVMRALPPDLPEGKAGHVPVAWPLDLLCDADDAGRVTGFLMGRVHDAVQVIDVYNPQTRLRECPLFDYRYLLRAARNLSAAVRACHARGYIIGDLKHSNVLVTQTALVTLVDTDSFQVRDPHTGQIFACPVRTPDFTPPELQEGEEKEKRRKGEEEIGRQETLTPYSLSLTPAHDLFALAVLNFHLLMEGTHPFAGVYLEEGDPPPFEERIARGHFPYGNRTVPYRANTRYAPPFEMLPPSLRALFVRCFEEGHDNPEMRPDARTWQAALDEAARNLSRCDANPQHFYGNHLDACPWCIRKQTQLRGLDPFPSEQAVQAKLNAQQPTPKGSASVSRLDDGYQAPSAPNSAPSSAEATGIMAFVGGLALFLFFIAIAFPSNKHHSSYVAESHKDEPVASFTTTETAPTSVTSTPASPSAAPAVPPDVISQVAYSPDGKTIAGIGKDILLWNAQSGKFKRRIPLNNAAVMDSHFGNALAFAPDSKTLAISSDSGTVKLWDTATGKCRLTIPVQGTLVPLAYSHDGKLLAVGGQNWGTEQGGHAIALFNAHTGATLHLLHDTTNGISMLRFSPRDDTLVNVGFDSAIDSARNPDWTKHFCVEGWNAATGQSIYRVKTDEAIYTLACSADGKTFTTHDTMTAFPFNVVRVWNMQTGALSTPVNSSIPGVDRQQADTIPASVTYSPSRASAAYINTNNIVIFDAATWQHRSALYADTTPTVQPTATPTSYTGFTSAAFSPDGSHIVTGSYTAGAQIWDAHTGKRLRTLIDTNDETQITASGLKYVDLVQGIGAMPRVGQQITVHYVGKFTDGTVFDSSYKHTDPRHPTGQPFEFTLGGQVIAAWNEGIATMRVGGKRRLICPPALAYGKSGIGSTIPPNATLIFDVELLQVGSHTFP